MKQLKHITLLLLLTLELLTISTGSTPTLANSTELLLITPKPNSWPGAWTAENPSTTEIGTSNLTLHYPQTVVNSTFFLNVTIKDVTNMKSWGIGVVFDHTKLTFKGARRPPDHVFKPVEDMGWTIIAPAVSIDQINETHSIIKWGCAYIMGEPAWSFSGSGTLCQIKFGIKREVNQTYPKWSTIITFDPEWTSIFLYPSGKIIPIFYPEKVRYLYPIPPTITILSFTPKRIVNPELTPCNSFNVNLTVTNATDLYKWYLEIFYSNQVLNATGSIEGALLKNYGTTVFNVQINQNYNQTHGQITLEQYLLNAEQGAYGTGCLATITFHVTSLGETSIIIANEKITNSENQDIPHKLEKGYFSNILIARIEVSPAEIRDPSLTPGQQFNINIAIDDVENLKNCTFKLTYDPEILLELAVTVPKILGQTPIKKIEINDFEGTIFVNIVFPNPITTYNATTITTITFEVQALGISPLNLTQTQLKDAYSQDIRHEVYNGIFIGLIRDVAVIQITVDKNSAYIGWPIYVNVTVANFGNLTETFTLQLYCNTTFIAQRNVTNIEPGNNRTITFLLNTTGLTAGRNYLIVAKALPVPYETVISNNIMQDGIIRIKLMGDVNSDNKVDMTDITIILDAFGTFIGHPRWNPNVDLFQDNKIDIADLILALDNYGKSC